jgi:hypothetical protein
VAVGCWVAIFSLFNGFPPVDQFDWIGKMDKCLIYDFIMKKLWGTKTGMWHD